MKYLWLILAVAVAAGQASAELKCFQCDNCASVAKKTATTCGSSPAEPSTTATPGNSTSPIPSSTSSSTNTQSTNNPTSSPSTISTESTTVQATTQPITEQTTDEPSSRIKQYEPNKHEKSGNSTFRPQEKLPAAETFNRQRRSIKSQKDSTSAYSCYKIHFKGTNGKAQINRGCVVTAKTDNDTCLLLSTSSVAVEKCSLCKKDSCNASSALMSSMALILASAVIIFFRQF